MSTICKLGILPSFLCLITIETNVATDDFLKREEKALSVGFVSIMIFIKVGRRRHFIPRQQRIIQGGFSLKISYLFDEDDYLNLQNFLRGWEIVSWLTIEIVILFVSFMIGGLIYWFGANVAFSSFFFLMTLLFLNLLLFGLFWLSIVIKLQFARKRGLFGWIHINFTDEGFYVLRSQNFDRSEENQGYFQAWSEVKRLRESKDYFYLSMGLGKEIMIPKRAFADGEVEQFKNYLKNGVGEKHK